MKAFAIVVALSVVLVQCISPVMDYSYSIRLKNDSTQPIVIYFSRGFLGSPVHPDTLLPEDNRYFTTESREEVAGLKSKTVLDTDLNWERIFEEMNSDTLSAFILSADTLNKYLWTDVRTNYRILKRYDLSKGDLERLNYQLTFPPEESMEGIRMYPE